MPLRAAVRRHLEVGACDDPHERQADDVAARVVAALGRQPDPIDPADLVGAPAALRRLPGTATVGAAGGAATPLVERLVADAGASGRELPPAVRQPFEDAMGADLSHVRMHTGPDVDAGSRSIGARAFTVGHDVFFGGGLPDTLRPDGQRVVAHELAHTLQGGTSVQPIRRLKDDDDVEVTADRIAAETDPAVLGKWKQNAAWDSDEDDKLVEAIEARLVALESAKSEAASKAAEDKAARIKKAAEEAAQARREAVQKTVGHELDNYDASVDADLKGLLVGATMKDPERSGRFFDAVKAAAPGQDPRAVLDTLKGDEVALESFIYGNGALGPAGAAKTTVAEAQAFSAMWADLGSVDPAIAAISKICVHIKAGRLIAAYELYRAATLTSTSGSKYYFKRPETARGAAKVEFHLHLGKPKDQNNAGFKVGSKGERTTLTAGDYKSLKDTITARHGGWPKD
ncbi:DUF4157 domain-containing protein [Nocardioides conyzicola]|uniref:eCIS core domain-containing protein n=1 Tax=Nocardioides conyzicola TaxID=1651781 RepID=A0ABP8WVW5_9ACTN